MFALFCADMFLIFENISQEHQLEKWIEEHSMTPEEQNEYMSKVPVEYRELFE
jgi:hypothetical protein